MATRTSTAAPDRRTRPSQQPHQDPAPRAARHAAFARTPPGRLVLRNLLRGRPQYLPLLLSDYGRAILAHKYDAFTTDLAYVKQPSGRLGPLGRLIDRIVLNVDLHADLRDRLRIVTAELTQTAQERRQDGAGPVRVLTVPSGLCRDLILAFGGLRLGRSSNAEDPDLWAIDLDERGDVIPEAERRCREAELAVRFCRADLLDGDAVRAALGDDPRFDVVNCIGLTPWLTLAEVERLVRFIGQDLLRPGGYLIVDNFARHSTSHTGPHLEIVTAYHDVASLAVAFANAGLTIVRRHVTARRVNTVYILQRLSSRTQ